MFSGLSFFRRGEQGDRRGLYRERRQRKLRLEVLEDRRMLASFGQSGTSLNIDLSAASESVGIVSNGATYALTLDASHTWTGTDTVDVAGSGSSTLTVSAAAFTSIQVTDSNSSGTVTFEDSGGNAYAASFTITLDNSPAGPVTFNGASSFGTSGLSVSTQANIVVSSGASVTMDGGQLWLDASAGQFQNAGTVSAGAGLLIITADSVAIQNTLTAAGGITLQPKTGSRTIGLNDATGAFNLTSEELGYLVSSGTVTIGAAAGVGAVRIGGAGAINLSLKSFDLTLRGGDVTFANRLQLPSTRTLTLNTGAVSSAPAGSVDIQVGTLSLATGGAVGAANNPLAVDLANLRGAVSGDLFLTEANQATIDGPLATGDDQTIHLIGGQLILGANERIGNASRINVNGGTLNMGAWNDTVRGVTLTSGQINGSGALTSTTTFQVQSGTISAKLGGSVGLIKTATGTITLSGANQYTGVTIIEAGGVLRIDKDACLGRPPDSSAPGRLELSGRLEATATLELAADREILLGDPSGTIVVPVNRTMTVRGNMAGNGLIKRGLGTLVLAGDNSFSGGVEYADQSMIRVDHANGFGTGTIHFTSNGTLQYGPGVTTDLSGQIAPWDPAVTVTINTGNNQVAFANPLGHAGVAEPAPASGTLFKTGTGKLTLAPTDTTYPTQMKLLYVEEGEFAVTRGMFALLGSATPVASVYTGSTSLFVKNATLTIAGGTVITQASLLLNYGAGANATLNVSSGKLEVPGDLVAGANRLATVNISVSGGATTEITIGRDFIVGLEGSSEVNISGGITQISGNLIAGQNGSGTVNVSGGTVNATSLRHVGGDDGTLNLTGGTVEVDEVVHQTANNDSNDSLKVYLGAINQNVHGTLITQRMYLDRTGGVDDGNKHEFLLFFDGGTLEAKADGNLIDGITDEVGNPVWQGLIDAVGPLDAAAFIYIPGNFDANVWRQLLHDPMLADTRDGGLTKQGTGKLTLRAENTFTGPVIIQSGTLALVNTELNNTIEKALYIDVQFGTTLDVTGLDTGTAVDTLVLAYGQTLKGTGTVQGNLIAAGGSTVAPGGSGLAEGSSPGILKQAGNYYMEDRSTLDIQIGGNTPGNGIGHHDQMLVTGAVSLGGATLALSSSDNYVPQLGDEYTIIQNDGSQAVSGTFAGLPEGYVFTDFLNSKLLARISYKDDTNEDATNKNDVVIRTFLPAAIGDRVWEDRNGDGLQDMDEPGLKGITVTVTGADHWGTAVHRTTTTGDDGTYRFNGQTLYPGTYTVTVSNPAGYVFSPPDQGDDDALDSDVDESGVAAAVTVGSGQTNLTIDAGLYQPVTVGDFIWEDLDADGIQDAGEPGLAGVSVTLQDAGGNAVSGPVTTGTDGAYRFTVAPGTYWVQLGGRAGYEFSPALQGGDPARDSDGPNSAQVTLTSGQSDLTIDAGLYQPVTVGDFVWEDLDADGIQDAGEPGLAGVSVTLQDADGNAVSGPGTTGADGAYGFTVTPGTYWVQFGGRAGYEFSPALQGGDPARDSDGPNSAQVTLTSGQSDLTIDAGLVPQAAAITLLKVGTFQDENGDGNADVGETIRYAFTVSNTGNGTLSNVTLADTVGGVTISGGPIGTLAAGAVNSTTFMGRYVIRWADIEAGSFSNTATVTGLDPNQEPVTATSQAIVPLTPPPILVLGPDKNPGTLQEVRVIDGDQGDVFWQFVAYENYVGGTRVAVADLNGDGLDEIITAPGRNHAPEIRIFTLQGDPVPGFPGFLAYDPAFISGVQLTVGYVDDDDLPDIITVPSYGAAEVHIFLNQYDPDDADHAIPAFSADPDISFQAFPVASIGGAVVAAGDMGRRVGDSFLKEPDGRAEIVVGTGNGTPAAVAIFDVAGLRPTRVTEFVPFATSNPGFLGGVSLDVAAIDEDAIPDVIVGMGVNGTSGIEVWTWNAADANLSLLGAIPNSFTGSSSNASISIAAADTDGSGFADAIFAVQGPVGKTGEIQRFDIHVDLAAAPPFSYQPALPLAGFTGPWFIATSKTVTSAAASEPAVPIAPPPLNAWTNLVNPWDINDDHLVTPLDVLETINYINIRAGETALPPQQFSPPRFFDSTADGAITPADVLVVLNYLNAGAATSGEGETSAPRGETDVIPGFPAAALGLAMLGGESPAADRPRDRGFAAFDLPGLPDAPWPPSAADAASRLAPGFVEPRLEEIDVFALDAVLEEIAAEIAVFV